LELLGDVNVAMGRYERAIEAYRRYLALDESRAARSLQAGSRVLPQRPANAAIESLRRALALDERFAEAHYLLAMCLKDQNTRQGRGKSLTRALAINPALGPAREELAGLDLAQGRTREGIEQLEAVAALEPSQPQRSSTSDWRTRERVITTTPITTLGARRNAIRKREAVYVALGRVVA
jgi:tetratricopeptide (TPR) repeat protein